MRKVFRRKKDGFSRRYKEWLAGIFLFSTALMIALIVVFGFFALKVSHNNVRDFYTQITGDLVHRHIQYLDDYFEPYFADLERLAKAEEVKSGEFSEAMDYIRRKISGMRNLAYDIFYAGNDGFASSISGRSFDVSDDEFFERIMVGAKNYVFSVCDTGISGGAGEFVIAKGVDDNEGKRIGVVAYSMMLSTIVAPVSGMTLGDIFYGFVIDTDGNIIVPLEIDSILNVAGNRLGQDDAHTVREFITDIKSGTEGTNILSSPFYPDEFIVWGKIDKTDWVIGVDAFVSKVDASSNIFRKQITICCAVLILCTIIAAVLLFFGMVNKKSSHRLTLQQDNDIDDLTGLWTEALFEEEVEKILKNNPDKNYLIMGLDIRGFRIVQQTEGIAAANQQLVMLSKRLREIAHMKKGYAARGHIDHFYVMYPIDNKETALREFDELLYNGNFLAGRAGELVPTKTGIVFAGKDYEKDTVHNLIGKTSYAKHMVQDNLLKNYSVYDSAMETRIINDKRIERYIPIAFSHDEFYVVYQPKINLTDGKVIGAEALVRWNSAELGNVMPDSFITLFERNGYINRLDFYVYKKVFEFMSKRIESKKPIVPISVNMSRFHLSDEKFVNKFYNLFKNYDIPHELIEVEILERSLGIADDRARQVAEELHENGFRVAIDDFGTGESSLSLISKIPADILKLDRKFMIEVENTTNSSEDEFMVVKQIVDMAKSLGKETICEGVETERQINFLRSINCNYVQGYFYSKPLSEKEFIAYLESHL